MLKIKRLYLYLVQSFMPVFFMTFGISLFILLMQFLWKYIEDLVGKGIDSLVLAELFFYSALGLIPMALPLAILLASLMTFGSLGERLELLSIKAAGVSLVRTMKPLIVLVVLIAMGDFFFQNNAMPVINVKSRSLLISVKQKSPELAIPEGSFYGGINRYNIYVKKKNPVTKMMYDMMIYDTSEGFENMSVFVCDSAHLQTTESKDNLVLILYDGQRFANFKDMKTLNTSSDSKFGLYGRENFKEKTLIIPFDSEFNRMDESNLGGTYISKNLNQLSKSTDSLVHNLDSININDRKTVRQQVYFGSNETYTPSNNFPQNESISQNEPIEPTITKSDKNVVKINFDSLVANYSHSEMINIMSNAMNESDNSRNSFMFQPIDKTGLQRNIRMHKIEWHKKIAWSFACIVFFFIGAPLGSIIRKGGLGMPVVISILLFIAYYIFDNIGYKMARDGVWDVWQGIWLSIAIFLPLGMFLTYKAMNDSTLFNPEVYEKYIRKILFIKEPPKMTEEKREQIVEKIPNLSELHLEPNVLNGLQMMDNDKLRNLIENFKDYDYEKNVQLAALSLLKEREVDISDIINKQDSDVAFAYIILYSKSSIITSIFYVFFLITLFTSLDGLSRIIDVSYVGLFTHTLFYYIGFYERTEKKKKIYHILILILSFLAYPLMFFVINKLMIKEMNKIKTTSFIA